METARISRPIAMTIMPAPMTSAPMEIAFISLSTASIVIRVRQMHVIMEIVPIQQLFAQIPIRAQLTFAPEASAALWQKTAMTIMLVQRMPAVWEHVLTLL